MPMLMHLSAIGEGMVLKYLGKPAYLRVPVQAGTAEWDAGMREITYLGQIASHRGGGMCLQPAWVKGAASEPACIAFDPDDAVLTVLTGEIGDYP